MTSPSPSRDGADRCPGLLAPFVSADGAMVRLRVPGGLVDTMTLGAISVLAGRFGDPTLTLTSRGSLQLRGLPDPLPQELTTEIDELGLIPSRAHDKARNILADPDAGLDDLVTALDSGLLADPALARLPGRFLLAVAGPGGPVLGEPWDIAVVDDGSTARVVVDGRATRHPRAEAPLAALEAARRFLAARPGTRMWNVRDLPTDARADLLPGGVPVVVDAADPLAPGVRGDDLVALVPLGLLTAEQVRSLAAAASTVRITPWRSILVPGGARQAEALAATGLVTSPGSPWTVLTACAGSPSCARTDTPTQDLAREAAPFVDPDGLPVHVIGCERACGHPAREHVTVLDPVDATEVVAAQDSPPSRKA